MATWGAYLSSYVKKNPGGTPADKDNELIITPILPLNTNTDVKTIEPLLSEEDITTPTPSEDVKKRFDEKLGSVGNLGMGTASVTRMPTLRSNSRGARMAKMFGYGTAKEEKVEEKFVEDKGEVETPVDESKETKFQVPPEMSKIEKLMAERKAAAIESRSTSPQNNESSQPIQSFKPLKVIIPKQQVESTLPTLPHQPTELVQPFESVEPPEPLNLVQETTKEYFQLPIRDESKPASLDTPTSARSSYNSARFSTKRASARVKTNSLISALDDLMASFSGDFASPAVTPKQMDNEKAVERPALGKMRNQRKPKASISALDDIMAGLYSMERAQNLVEVRKVEPRDSGISITDKESEVVQQVLPPAPEISIAVPETSRRVSQTPEPKKIGSKAISRFPVVISQVPKTNPNIPAPIGTGKLRPLILKGQLSPLPQNIQTITTIPRSPMINGQLSPIPPQFRLRPKRSFKDMVKLATSSRFAQVAEQAVEAEAERKLLQYERQAEQMLLEKEEMEEKRMLMEESFQKMQEEDERIAREAEEMMALYEQQQRIRIETEAEEERLRRDREGIERQARVKRERREAEERAALEEAERLTAQIKAFEKEQEKLAQEAAKRFEEEQRLAEIERKAAARRYEEEQRIAAIERQAEKERLEEEERLAYEEQLREEEFEELQRQEEERIYAEQARQRDEIREREARERVERMEAQMREEERLRAERDEKERLQMEEEEEERRAYEERIERQRQRDQREMEMMRRREEQEKIAEQQRFDAQREMERMDMIEREEREAMRMEQERQEAEMDREREEAIRLQKQQQVDEFLGESDDDERPLTKEEEIAKAEEKIRLAFAGMAAQKAGLPPPAAPKPFETQFMQPARPLAPRPSIKGGLPGGPRGGGLPSGPRTGMGLPSGPRGGLPAGPRMRRV